MRWRKCWLLAGCCRVRWTGCFRGCRATCGGHTHEVPGRFVPSWRVEVSASAMALCLVKGWESCSATTLIVSTGG